MDRPSWTFLTNHASVLLCIYRRDIEGAPARVRDIAATVGITERTVQHILKDLEDGGYLTRSRVGNRTHYTVRTDLPLRRHTDDGVALRDLLGTLVHAQGPADDGIRRGLRALRRHLDMDVAFASHLTDGVRRFDHVDTATLDSPIAVGDSDPAAESYCQHVIDGRIPQLLIDPAKHPVAGSMPVTADLPVGTHLSVPIVLPDGIYGTCCCFSYDVQPHRDERDLAAVGMLADLVAGYLHG